MANLKRAFELLFEIQISPEWDMFPAPVADRLEEVMQIIEQGIKEG